MVSRSSEPIRIALVERHSFLRAAMREQLASSLDAEVVAEYRSVQELLPGLAALRAHVVVVSVSIPADDCLLLLDRLAEAPAGPAVVALRVGLRPEMALTLLRRGVHGVLDELSPEADVASAISAAARGNTFVNGHVSELLAQSSLPGSNCLTSQELRVLSLLVRGESNTWIARQLDLKEKTVETHLTHIYSKLNVRSRSQAILTALQLHLPTWLPEVPARRAPALAGANPGLLPEV